MSEFSLFSHFARVCLGYSARHSSFFLAKNSRQLNAFLRILLYGDLDSLM